MQVKRRVDAICDECGEVIPRGTSLSSQPPVRGVPRRTRHIVCPGDDRTGEATALGDVLELVLDNVERRGLHPDEPIDLIPVEVEVKPRLRVVPGKT